MWGFLATGGKIVASFVPGGQIVGIFSAIGSAIAGLCRAVFEAITVTIANPVVLILLVVAFGGGFYEGVRWDRHKVEVANAKLIAVHKEWKDANDRNATDLAEALVARQKAEELAKGVEGASKSAAIAAGRAAERVRVKPAATAPANQPGWVLPGIPGLFGKN